MAVREQLSTSKDHMRYPLAKKSALVDEEFDPATGITQDLDPRSYFSLTSVVVIPLSAPFNDLSGTSETSVMPPLLKD